MSFPKAQVEQAMFNDEFHLLQRQAQRKRKVVTSSAPSDRPGRTVNEALVQYDEIVNTSSRGSGH